MNMLRVLRQGSKRLALTAGAVTIADSTIVGAENVASAPAPTGRSRHQRGPQRRQLRSGPGQQGQAGRGEATAEPADRGRRERIHARRRRLRPSADQTGGRIPRPRNHRPALPSGPSSRFRGQCRTSSTGSPRGDEGQRRSAAIRRRQDDHQASARTPPRIRLTCFGDSAVAQDHVQRSDEPHRAGLRPCGRHRCSGTSPEPGSDDAGSRWRRRGLDEHERQEGSACR